jgi:hypothetical protein
VEYYESKTAGQMLTPRTFEIRPNEVTLWGTTRKIVFQIEDKKNLAGNSPVDRRTVEAFAKKTYSMTNGGGADLSAKR